jgi:putative Mg2+ transporter-C (MgtC) family protein
MKTDLILLGRIALGTFIGYVIGYERELRGKVAGDRTFALVALGTAAFTAIGVEHFPRSGDRIVQGIATGIGFLGAGLIFRRQFEVHGLTTAAAVWAIAALGALAGTGEYLLAVVGAVLVLVILEITHLPALQRLDFRTGHRPRDGSPTDAED